MTKHDAEMLRRAVRACRNLQAQAARLANVGDTEWFSWVPTFLNQIAERVEATAE